MKSNSFRLQALPAREINTHFSFSQYNSKSGYTLPEHLFKLQAFCAGEGKMFSPGNLRATFDNPAYERLISYYVGEKYTLRYTGGMVPGSFLSLVSSIFKVLPLWSWYSHYIRINYISYSHLSRLPLLLVRALASHNNFCHTLRCVWFTTRATIGLRRYILMGKAAKNEQNWQDDYDSLWFTRRKDTAMILKSTNSLMSIADSGNPFWRTTSAKVCQSCVIDCKFARDNTHT